MVPSRARVAHALPELVILDLVLPKMSGLECRRWRVARARPIFRVCSDQQGFN